MPAPRRRGWIIGAVYLVLSDALISALAILSASAQPEGNDW